MKAAFLILMLPVLLALQTDDKDKYISDFKLIEEAYKKHHSLQFSMVCQSFKDSRLSKADTINNSTYYFKGKNFYYRASTTEVLKNETYLISVDHFKKAIIIYKSSEYKDDFLPVNMVDSFLIKNTVQIKYAEKQNGKTGSYVMNILKSNTAFSKMELEFDKTTYLVNKMSLYIPAGKLADSEGAPTADGSRVDYIFSNYKSGNIDDRIFATSRFINIDGEKFKAAAAYRDFKVIPLIPVQQQSK